MHAADARCDRIARSISGWHADLMDERDRDTYEQHLLFCPPCRVQNVKAGIAFGALRAAGTRPPDPELLQRLGSAGER